MLNPAFWRLLGSTCCEIYCILKTTAKKLGGPIHCWSNLKVGGTSLPGPYGGSSPFSHLVTLRRVRVRVELELRLGLVRVRIRVWVRFRVRVMLG